MNIQLPVSTESLLQTTAVPYPINILRKKPWYSFIKQNGYQTFAKRLMVKVFSDSESAQELWQAFSPNRSMFDMWEVRRMFAQSFNREPYFLTLYEQSDKHPSILGVLPLWIDNDIYEGDYTWFGGFWPEDNTFFVKDPEVIPLLLMVAPKPLLLHSITPTNEYDFLTTLSGFTEVEDKKYYLNLEGIHSVEEYLRSLRKKKRHNLRRDQKHILSLHPAIEFGNQQHLSRMFDLNIERINELRKKGLDDRSVFEKQAHQTVFKKLLTIPFLESKIISTRIKGVVEAVEMGFVFKDTYYALTSGANIKKYSGLGVFSNLLVIEEAIRSGCSRIDFLSVDYNWKESWGFYASAQYQFTK